MANGDDRPQRPQGLTGRTLWVARTLCLAVPVAAVLLAPAGALVRAATSTEFAKGVAAYDAKDYVTAYREWLPLAKDGDPAAQRNIGHMFRRGLGVKQDLDEAIKWYRAAAEQGFDRAQANLAYMYLNGDGVARDFSKAAEWFYQAAIQGHPIAQFNLGQMYQLGWGVPKDLGRAMAWYNLAAKAGHKKALDRLSVLVLQSGPPKLENDGGKSLPAGMPEGEPGWDEEPMQVAQAPRGSEPAPAQSVKQDKAVATGPAPLSPVKRVEQPLPLEKQVAIATLPPPAEPAKPAAAPPAQTATAPPTTTQPADQDTAETAAEPEKDDGGGFFSRFFSLKAVPGQDNSGTREMLAGAVVPDQAPAAAEPAATQTAADTAAAADDKGKPVPQTAEPAAAAEPAPVQVAATSAPTVTPASAPAAAPATTRAPSPDAKPAPAPTPTEAVTQAKPWVNPDTLPAAASAAVKPESAKVAPAPAQTAAAPIATQPVAAPTVAAKPERPDIKITVINPPLDEPADATLSAEQPAEPKQEKGFFARLFGGGDEETGADTDKPAQTTANPAAEDKPVVDLTALPKQDAKKAVQAADLAPKVKGVEVAVLAPPAARQPAAAAPAVDKPVKTVMRPEATRAMRRPAAIEPVVPIPDPSTGPTEAAAHLITAQKTASAGQPRQRADDNPQEYFAPKVTIDWNTVLQPSSAYSPPAAAKQAAEKLEKGKSLADSDTATLTALAAEQGLIDTLQLGLLAYRSRDYKTAIKYWLPMAHSGQSRAQFYMGGLYHDGSGVERDPIQAFMWWSLAADKGYNPALTARERLRDSMTEVEVAEALNRLRSWRPVSE